MTVETARGPIPSAQLGTTLMHEHIFVMDPAVVQDYGNPWWDEDVRIADAVAKLQGAKAKGIDTLVDVTVLGIGRDIRLLRAIAERVDLNLVLATGLYTYGDLPRLFRNVGPGLAVQSDEPMVAAFLGDIRDGIAGTPTKAGMLKCVWDTVELRADALRVQRAISRVQVESGVPLTVHTNSSEKTGRAALELYRREGVNLSSVILGHAGDSTDLDYLRELMDTGATTGFDRFGLDVFGTTADRVRTLAALCDEGYADRIILSQDAAAFTESWAHPAAQAELRRRLPNWHYTYVIDVVLDLLRERGVTDAQLRQMLVDNPRRILTGI